MRSGTRQQRVLKLDSVTGSVQEMEIGPGLPELSWPTGVAYDSRRGRILVVSLGGVGYLYAYRPETGEWSVVAGVENRDFESLVYHAPEDVLYGLKVYQAASGNLVLYRLDAAGGCVGEIALEPFPHAVSPTGYHSELASVGDYVVLLLAPRSWPPSEPSGHDSRLYMIDPRSGQFWLTYQRVGAVEEGVAPVIVQAPADRIALVGASTSLTVAACVSIGHVGWNRNRWRSGLAVSR